MPNKKSKKVGKVYLVGAGPGDPGLLTLRAAQVLSRADVICYDHLVHPSILDYAPAKAQRISVGKRAGVHTMPQKDIGRLLIAQARAGRCVVRLKGGDPFVFGRGGEEALDLANARIPFEIVPGVTSAIAVPAYAGIPVTSRSLSSSCAIVTGHEDPKKGKSDMDWNALAHGPQTLVFLMGTKNLGRICKNLLQAGLKKSTPCAVISSGTTASQKTLTATLSTIAQAARKKALPMPTVLVVGEVVRLHKSLSWFESRPLRGKTVLVTRAREQASELVLYLEDLGARVHEAPAIRIMPPDSYEALDRAIQDIRKFCWVFFTSVNGARAFLARFAEKDGDLKALRKIKLAVIGTASLEPLQEAGLKASLIPRRFVSEGIIEEIDRRKISLRDVPVLLVRAQEVREFFAQALQERGAIVEEAPAYKTVSETQLAPQIISALRSGSVDWITFTSSSTVKNFFGLLNGDVPKQQLSRIGKASIGPITSGTLREFGHPPTVEAHVHTIPGLVHAILRGYK